jgi:hypothetical protein
LAALAGFGSITGAAGSHEARVFSAAWTVGAFLLKSPNVMPVWVLPELSMTALNPRSFATIRETSRISSSDARARR